MSKVSGVAGLKVSGAVRKPFLAHRIVRHGSGRRRNKIWGEVQWTLVEDVRPHWFCRGKSFLWSVMTSSNIVIMTSGGIHYENLWYHKNERKRYHESMQRHNLVSFLWISVKNKISYRCRCNYRLTSNKAENLCVSRLRGSNIAEIWKMLSVPLVESTEKELFT